MKRTICIFIVMIMLISVSACGKIMNEVAQTSRTEETSAVSSVQQEYPSVNGVTFVEHPDDWKPIYAPDGYVLSPDGNAGIACPGRFEDGAYINETLGLKINLPDNFIEAEIEEGGVYTLFKARPDGYGFDGSLNVSTMHEEQSFCGYHIETLGEEGAAEYLYHRAIYIGNNTENSAATPVGRMTVGGQVYYIVVRLDSDFVLYFLNMFTVSNGVAYKITYSEFPREKAEAILSEIEPLKP